MPLPRLIHPINITIERIDRDATEYDEDAREPIQQAEHKTSVTLKGQPKWGSEEELGLGRGGPSGSSRGYVLFRRVDLDAAGVEPQLNDRIIMQGHLEDEVYVSRIQPMGHYPDQNGASLLRAWFTDRKPAKQRFG